MLTKKYANEFLSKPAAGNEIILDLDISAPKLIDGLILRGVGHTNTNAQLDVSTVISEVRVFQDQNEKCLIKPSLQRLMDDFLNSNSDTLPIDSVYIPFNRFLHPDAGWGTANIGKLLVKVKCTNPFPANTTFTDIRPFWGYHALPKSINRGNVFLQSVIPLTNVVGGWNTINDFPYYNVASYSKMLFNQANVTEVKITRGDVTLYHAKKCDALTAMKFNDRYKVPSTCAHVEIDGALSSSTGPFPVLFDDLGPIGDMADLFVNNEKQLIKVEYYVDTNVSAAANFDVLIEGFELEAQVARQTAVARA